MDQLERLELGGRTRFSYWCCLGKGTFLQLMEHTYECTLPPSSTTLLNVSSMLSTAKVVSTAISGLSGPQAWMRHPSGTWMNAPCSMLLLSPPCDRNMWIVGGFALSDEEAVPFADVLSAVPCAGHCQPRTAV